VDIHLVSSFTAEDEDQFAPLIMGAITELFEKTSVAYAIRIETAAGRVVQRTGCGLDLPQPPPVHTGRKRDTSRR
jgi:hypothetical protein